MYLAAKRIRVHPPLTLSTYFRTVLLIFHSPFLISPLVSRILLQIGVSVYIPLGERPKIVLGIIIS